MFQAKVYFKMQVLFLVVLISVIITSSLKVETHAQQIEQLYGTNETIRIDPQPDLGFYYPYYLFIPDNTRTNAATYMLVEPNNTGTRTDDFTIHEQKAKTTLERGYPNQIANRMGIPLLIPVFPRSNAQPLLYIHELDRDSLLIKEVNLQRADLQLIAMIHHAQKLLREKGVMVHDKVFLDGFSDSGQFVNRFTILHPDYVKAVACGGMNSKPMLPFAKLEGEKLIYPIGVYDLKELTGSEFRFREYKRIPQYIYQGSLDTNDALPALEAYGLEEVRLVKKILHEKMMPERWEAAKHWNKKAGISAQFVVYNYTYHEVRNEIIYDVVRFFQANTGERFVPIQPYQYSPIVGLKKVHIKDILFPGNDKIPKFFTSKDYKFIISIVERLAGYDYHQFTEFKQRAGFNFEIVDIESGNVVCIVDGSNHLTTISSDNFQGYAVRLGKKQIDALQEGKKYTIRPLNSSDVYQWSNEKGVSFVWKDCK